MKKEETGFKSLLEEIEDITKKKNTKNRKLKQICEILKTGVTHYDWVGFYLVEGCEELVLGPFSGAPTEHTEIGFGQGICGQAAERGETFVVQDVTKEKNYLSCSPTVKSEIVVPIFKEGKLVGELDIDSHEKAPFTQEDEEFLKNVCALASKIL
jgi:GAF domain-containing protein